MAQEECPVILANGFISIDSRKCDSQFLHSLIPGSQKGFRKKPLRIASPPGFRRHEKPAKGELLLLHISEKQACRNILFLTVTGRTKHKISLKMLLPADVQRIHAFKSRQLFLIQLDYLHMYPSSLCPVH